MSDRGAYFIGQNRGMSTTFPFSLLESLATRFQPPAWVVDEGQQRLVLLVNHVVMQEKEAQDRLTRKKGNVIHVRWGVFAIDLRITPAGLFERVLPLADQSVKPDLLVSVAVDSPVTVVQSLLAGKPPPVKIEGDVQLAAELGWLAENLRWDVEEDLSRVLGDIPAHALADAGRKLLAGLKQFAAMRPGAQGAASTVVAPMAASGADAAKAST